MSRFGPDPHAFFKSIYTQTPPWDIGKPQPAMAELLTRYPPISPILDVGCGSGDLSVYLAHLGYRVVGIDFVDTAIAIAQTRRSLLPAEVASYLHFQVADALNLPFLQQQFGSVVDSGFLHLLEPEQCEQFVAELTRTIRPGGRYYLHAFAVEFPMPNVPRSISAAELHARFSVEQGWQINTIDTTEFLSRMAPPVPALCACIERMPGNQE